MTNNKFIIWLWSKVWWYWLQDRYKVIYVKGWNCALVEDVWRNRSTIIPCPIKTIKHKWSTRTSFKWKRKYKGKPGWATCPPEKSTLPK